MKFHFVSTGNKFPYPYYHGIKSLLDVIKDKHEIVLHILQEPNSKYFNQVKELPISIKKESIDMSLPVFSLDYYEGNSTPKMIENWKLVMMFDYLVWKIVSKEGGVIMGLDSISFKDWTGLLPQNKEMLVPISPGNKIDSNYYAMHGVIVREGSELAKLIFSDIEKVMQGIDPGGEEKSIIDDKYHWGGAGIIPYLNRTRKSTDTIEVVDLKEYTMPLFASSRKNFDELDEGKIAELSARHYPKNDSKYRFHIPGYVHLPVSEKYMGCAFTQKIVKLSKMLLSLGHEVFIYGSEGSDVPCTEFIQTHTLKDIRDTWGDGDKNFEIGYNWKVQDFRHDFNKERTDLTIKFQNECIYQINRRKNPDDFLLVMQGYYHKPIADKVKLWLTCEPGIGYRGSYTRFRAFESAYLQNFTYGSENPKKSINGSHYDRVIPNYFDPKDFDFSNKKDDYYLYIGRMIWRKGVNIAVDTCKALDAKIILAGQGDIETNYKKVEKIGYVDVEARKKLMSRAKAVFVPTIYLEAFAGTHVEAMLSGTPVITTNFGVFPGTIPDHLNGVVGFRCNTLQDFVDAAKKSEKCDPYVIRKYAERFLMDNVKYEFQKWFEDLYHVYESAMNKEIKGWSRLK